MMKRALVSGGAGFIGSNLVLELEAQGFEVTALDNLVSGTKSNLAGFRGTFVQADTTQPIALKSEKFDAVFHHGDITDPRYPDDDKIYQKNLSSFQNLLNVALSSGARFIYASTAGLYGNGPMPMKEEQPKHIITAYARSKLAMDEMAVTYCDRIPIIGLRYFNVFGPRETQKGRAASMIYHLSRQMLKGQKPRLFRHGEQKRDFIYVKDVVGANLCALTGESGVYNVGTGVATTFNELVTILNEVLGTSLSIEYFDMPYSAQTYQHNTQADTTAARKTLGFSSRWSLKDATADYMEWLAGV